MADTAYVDIQPHAQGLICRVTAEKVGAREAQVIEHEVRKAAPTGGGGGGAKKWRVVMDLASVEMLASMGLGMLVSLNKDCNKEGGRMVICGIKPEIMEVLKITHLERILRIVPDRDAAVKGLG